MDKRTRGSRTINGIIEFVSIAMLTVLFSYNLGKLFRMKKKAQQFFVLFSLGVVFIPLPTLSPAQYTLSLLPNFSIGTIALLGIFLGKQLKGVKLFSSQDFALLCAWNLLLSLSLYASSFSLIAFDLYYLGYGFSGWFIITAGLTLILLFQQSQLFYIFLAYIIAFNLNLSYANNFFDYIVDPLAALISLFVLIWMAVQLIFHKGFTRAKEQRVCN